MVAALAHLAEPGAQHRFADAAAPMLGRYRDRADARHRHALPAHERGERIEDERGDDLAVQLATRTSRKPETRVVRVELAALLDARDPVGTRGQLRQRFDVGAARAGDSESPVGAMDEPDSWPGKLPNRPAEEKRGSLCLWPLCGFVRVPGLLAAGRSASSLGGHVIRAGHSFPTRRSTSLSAVAFAWIALAIALHASPSRAADADSVTAAPPQPAPATTTAPPPVATPAPVVAPAATLPAPVSTAGDPWAKGTTWASFRFGYAKSASEFAPNGTSASASPTQSSSATSGL
jgi:hypothetical protein